MCVGSFSIWDTFRSIFSKKKIKKNADFKQSGPVVPTFVLLIPVCLNLNVHEKLFFSFFSFVGNLSVDTREPDQCFRVFYAQFTCTKCPDHKPERLTSDRCV